MDSLTILSGLEEVARRLGLEVRYEALRGDEVDLKSGRCRLKGKEILFIDQTLNLTERINVLVSELARMNLTGIYIKPYLRALLQSHPGEDPKV